MCRSHVTGFTVDLSLRILFSRLTVQGRLRGAWDVKAGGTTMMIDLIVMIGVECPLLPREVGLTPIGSKMTDASSVLGGELQSTPESQALTRDPSSCKVWSTGTELTEAAMTEMCPQAAESTFQVQNVLAERSEPQ